MAKAFQKHPGPGKAWSCRGNFDYDLSARRFIRKLITAPSRSEVLREAAELEARARRMASGSYDPEMAARNAALGRPIEDLIEEYRAVLTAKGNSPHHIARTISAVKYLAGHELCGFGTLSRLNAGRIAGWVAASKKQGAAAKTINNYIQAVRQFCTWAVEKHALHSNPIATLKRLNVNADPRYVRRAFTVDEWQRLLAATAASEQTFCGLTGPERALLYRVTLAAGLRPTETRRIKVGDFDLTDPADAWVLCRATWSKARREDTVPIPADVAADLATAFEGRPADALAFVVPMRTAEMFRMDAEAAGIDCKGHGVLDFYSIRVTTGTMLARMNIHPRKAMTHMRHTSIALTMRHYTKLTAAETRVTANALTEAMLGATVVPQNGPNVAKQGAAG